MIKKRAPYKTYTKEFKLEALRLVEESDRPASEVARELGIRRNQLYKWAEQRNKAGEQAFQGHGRPRKEDQHPLTTLKQENARLREEVDILKKAAAYFARNQR